MERSTVQSCLAAPSVFFVRNPLFPTQARPSAFCPSKRPSSREQHEIGLSRTFPRFRYLDSIGLGQRVANDDKAHSIGSNTTGPFSRGGRKRTRGLRGTRARVFQEGTERTGCTVADTRREAGTTQLGGGLDREMERPPRLAASSFLQKRHHCGDGPARRATCGSLRIALNLGAPCADAPAPEHFNFRG
jgi:hypothetical protein